LRVSPTFVSPFALAEANDCLHIGHWAFILKGNETMKLVIKNKIIITLFFILQMYKNDYKLQ
jgi:hypothetical protein